MKFVDKMELHLVVKLGAFQDKTQNCMVKVVTMRCVLDLPICIELVPESTDVVFRLNFALVTCLPKLQTQTGSCP